MTKRSRRWLLGLLLVAGGFIAVMLAGPLLLDQERYRGILISRASQLLNRTVTVSSLRVHLLPSPGVTIRDVSIADRAPWSEPFLDAEQLNIALKLLPLLKGVIQVSDIRIDRPRIRLTKGSDGWNFDDFIRPTARGTDGEPRRTEGARAVAGQSALPVMAAGGLTIRHGILILDNPLHPSGPATVELKDVNLDIPAPRPPHPLPIHISGLLPDKISGSFDLTGSLPLRAGDHSPIEVELHMRDLDVAQLASTLGIPHTSSSMAALSGTIDLDGKAVGEWPVLDLQADVDLQRVGVTVGQETGRRSKDKAWLRTKGRWEGDRLDLSEMNLLWNGHTTTGRLQLTTQKSPRIQFWLDTPDLSIEPFVALATTTDTKSAPSPTPPVSRLPSPLSAPSPTPSPAKPNDGLQIEGHVRAGTLHWGRLTLTTAESDLHYCCGLLSIRRLQGGFYSGNLSGNAALSFSERGPRMQVTTHLEGIQIEPLLQAFQAPRWNMRGMMTLDSNMEFSGHLGSETLTRISGQADLAVTNGRVTGYTPLERLSKTIDPILKGVGISVPALNEFDRLSAHWTLDDGILRTKDLMLLRDGAKFYAAGSINLLNQALDIDVTARLAKITIEARVQGTSSDPTITPQMGRIEGRIKTEVSKLLGADREKELGKMLRQHFSR